MTTTMAGIIKRGDKWHFRWVVPEEFREIAGKREIHKSLKTDSKAEALARAADYECELRARFEAALAGKNPAAEGMERFSAAVRIAQGLGRSYKSAKDLAAGRVEDILARVEAVRDVSPDGSNAGAVAAVLGGVEAPGLRLSELPEHVEGLNDGNNVFKNPTQLRKWRGGNRRSIAQAIEAIGDDILVRDFTAEHAMKHLLWFKKKVLAKKITVETAKKELTYAAACFRRYYHAAGVVDAPRPYLGRTISKGVAKAAHRTDDEKRKREFPVDWITGTLLQPGVLDGLNPEARDILLTVVETGCRQSEVYNTALEDIRVDHEYPHFYARNIEGIREVKNLASERLVPLVGIALSAMKRVVARGDFQKYEGKDTWSAAVNKYLRERGVLEEGYTMGGLWHSWEGRMEEAGFANDIRGAMMGHSVENIRGRKHYGDYVIKKRHGIAVQVSLNVPDPVEHLGDRVIAAARKPRATRPRSQTGSPA